MDTTSLLLREAPHPPSDAWVLQAAAEQLCTTSDALEVVGAAIAGLDTDGPPVNPFALYCQVWTPALRALTPAQLVLAWRIADYLMLVQPVTTALAHEVLQRKCKCDAKRGAAVMRELAREGMSREHVMEVDRAYAAIVAEGERRSTMIARFMDCAPKSIKWGSPLARGVCAPRTVRECCMTVAWGHLDLLKATSIHANMQLRIMSFAAASGHLHVLQWARGLGYDAYPNASFVASGSAALLGHLDILQWLHAREYPMTERLCESAACGGHLHVLRWAIERGCALPATACMNAAIRSRDLATFQFVCDRVTFDAAAEGECCCRIARDGSLDMLRDARRRGWAWDARVCHMATVHGRLEVLQWARANGCPWDFAHVLRWCKPDWCDWWAPRRTEGHKAILAWLKALPSEAR